MIAYCSNREAEWSLHACDLRVDNDFVAMVIGPTWQRLVLRISCVRHLDDSVFLGIPYYFHKRSNILHMYSGSNMQVIVFHPPTP
jgi:hypothetical protein